MPPAPQPPFAGLLRRFGSIAYEGLLLTAILFVSTWLCLFFTRVLEPSVARHVLQLWLLTVTAAYFVYCWTRSGQTLPMKTWRIRVTTIDGGALSLSLALRRFGLALLTPGIGFVWALLDRDGQFLHDRLCDTRLLLSEKPRDAADDD